MALHLEAFAVAEKLDAPRDTVGALEGLASGLAMAGRHTLAAEVLGAASAARRASALPPSPSEEADLTRAANASRTAFGEEIYTAAYERGGGMTPDEARLLATGVPADGGTRWPTG